MTAETLNQAMQYIRSGNKPAALPLLKQLVQAEPKNEAVWLGLYACMDDVSQKKYCLQKALEINPANAGARRALEQLAALESPLQPVPAAPVRPVTPARPAAAPAARAEVTYYQKEPVQVTSSRVVFGGVTHILRNISSVGAVKLPPRRKTGRILAFISFVIMICLGLSTIGSTKSSTVLFIFELLSFLGIVAGLILSFTARPHYAVRLVSSAGELNGYVSREEREVTDIVTAINQAIVDRG